MMKRVLLFLIFIAAAGCAAPAPAVQLPTRVPAAGLLGAAPAVAVAEQQVPPTFTPQPGATVEAGYGYVPLSATITPSPTPLLPSRTPTPTFTPSPTPIFTATAEAGDFSAPFAIPNYPSSDLLGPSKAGIHVVRNNSANIMNFVRATQPAVVKGVGDLGWLEEVKQVSPRTITIGRIDDVFIQNYIGTPEEAAREYVEKHIQTYLANPYVDYWEGWNEPDPGLGRMSWYARLESERVRLMAAYGLKSAIGGFPPGVPELDEFALFMPAIATAKEYGGILTLHEGDIETGDMRYLYGAPLEGYPTYPDRGLMSFRYRWFYRELLEPNDLVIPLVISELEFAGWDTTDAPGLIDQVAWYDREARKDGYVIGFTVFTAGAIGQWHEFDLNGILPEMARYVNSQDGR